MGMIPQGYYWEDLHSRDDNPSHIQYTRKAIQRLEQTKHQDKGIDLIAAGGTFSECVTKYLTTPDIMRLSLSSKQMWKICYPMLWRLIAGLDFNRARLPYLLLCLGNFKFVKVLDLSDCSLSRSHFPVIAHTLRRSTIESLSLRWSESQLHIVDRDVCVVTLLELAANKAYGKFMRSLDLGGNKLSVKGVCALTSWLRRLKPHPLTELCLRSCDITKDGLHLLVESVTAGHASGLKHLDISMNYIYSPLQGGADTTDAAIRTEDFGQYPGLTAEDWEAFAFACPGMTYIDFSGGGIDENFRGLGSAITAGAWPKLTVLRAESCDLFDDGVQDFLYALRENKCPQIEELNLRMSGLSPSSCVLLARAIQEGDLVNSLQVLDWEDNELSYEGLNLLMDGFRSSTFPCCSIKILNLNSEEPDINETCIIWKKILRAHNCPLLMIQDQMAQEEEK